MAEDVGLGTYFRHHTQRIVLFLAAMQRIVKAAEQFLARVTE
ncbi:MAG: hypothetical protein H7Y89_04510 [Steroidobacteraceae bacterium]|nr:hypothetical protein [Steroidobacteraceae bacterium]